MMPVSSSRVMRRLWVEVLVDFLGHQAAYSLLCPCTSRMRKPALSSSVLHGNHRHWRGGWDEYFIESEGEGRLVTRARAQCQT